MISIHFQEQIDCEILFKQLKSYLEKYIKFGLRGRVECTDQHVMTIYYENNEVNFYESFHPLLVNVFTKHIISLKEEEWLLDIIESIFYFKDHEEQVQILSIARSIMEGDHEDIPRIKNRYSREESIYQAFSSFLVEEASFYYESFLKFRLKSYFEYLVETVEIAIDEYMLEQEYQQMVENFRLYIKESRPVIQQLHVVVDHDTFFIYNDRYQLLEPKEIEKYYNESLKFEEGLRIEQMIISPLVSFAPQKLTIYTDDMDHGIVQTIQSIFEERVSVVNKDEFLSQHIQKLQNN